MRFLNIQNPNLHKYKPPHSNGNNDTVAMQWQCWTYLVLPRAKLREPSWEIWLSTDNTFETLSDCMTTTLFQCSSVTNILSFLGWEKLTDRRETHQVSQLYKITTKAIGIDASHHLQSKIQRSRRGNTNQFNIPQSSSTAFKNSFFPKIH